MLAAYNVKRGSSLGKRPWREIKKALLGRKRRKISKRMPKKEECKCHHGKKSVCLGCIVFLLGLLWYLRDTGYITYAYFWPVVMMGLGVLLVIKGIIKALMK
jgi:hypothetical protein